MKRAIAWILCFSVLVAPLALSGCETYGKAGGLGAGIGAVTGAVIGNQSGNALEGAAIGAVVGGLVGLVAHDVKARRERTAAQTVETYNYQPAQGLVLRFERAEILPNNARPGEIINSTIQYALLGSGPGMQVTETRSLMRGDRLVSTFNNESFQRDDGTWVSSKEFQLPNDIAPGVYSIDTRVTAGQLNISGAATFSVQ